jgi:hypothetical protein
MIVNWSKLQEACKPEPKRETISSFPQRYPQNNTGALVPHHMAARVGESIKMAAKETGIAYSTAKFIMAKYKATRAVQRRPKRREKGLRKDKRRP